MIIIIKVHYRGPLLPRRVSSPFLPLAATPDTAQTLPHGAAMHSCAPRTSGSASLPSHGRNESLRGTLMVAVAAAMVLAMVAVAATTM